MCGIAGIIGQINNPSIDELLATQHHRGPDSTNFWSAENAILGHNRLSILDLTAAGNQPMHSQCGRYTIIFNGEVYNYKELATQYLKGLVLKSHSDTEVLLELYALKGYTMLNELIGMFAFAIWDHQEQQLFAARDRFGVKPFHYSLHNGHFLFASEIKSLWKAGIPREYQEEVWAGYFANGTYGQPHQTFWKHINALPASHMLRWKPGMQTPVIQRWYKFEDIIQEKQLAAPTSNMEQYQHQLIDVIRLRFRSDVPVGVAVSGGLDSSLLLASIHQAFPDRAQLDAYTFYSNDPQYDELPWVRPLTNRTGISLHPVLLEWQQVPALAQAMSQQQDEPFGGFPTLAYSNIFKQARSMGTYVLLDGQGIDEAWAGYDYYWNSSTAFVQATGDSPVRPSALAPEFAGKASNPIFDKPFSNQLLNNQYRDLFFTKLPRALRFNDRASMLHSVELREPFLDHRMVEFAFALPETFKMQEGLPKYALRKLAEKWTGSNIALAPKRPVQTPQREWLREQLKDWADDHIQTLATLNNPGWFDRREMLQQWHSFCKGESNNSFYVWQWINTALLLK